MDQSLETVPVMKLCWKIVISIGAISKDVSGKPLAGIQGGLLDLTRLC